MWIVPEGSVSAREMYVQGLISYSPITSSISVLLIPLCEIINLYVAQYSCVEKEEDEQKVTLYFHVLLIAKFTCTQIIR